MHPEGEEVGDDQDAGDGAIERGLACAAIQTMSSSRSARPICVGGNGSRSSRGSSLLSRAIFGAV
jgi:hypothetical protein